MIIETWMDGMLVDHFDENQTTAYHDMPDKTRKRIKERR